MGLGLPFYRTYERMVKESNPFNRIHRLLDTFEEFSKFLTIISIREFIRVRQVEEAESQSISSFLINRLYAPTLGTWHEFLYRSAKYLAGLGVRSSVFSEEVYTLLGYKQRPDAALEHSCSYKGKEYEIKNIQEAFNIFTEMRNDYAHGATPGDDTCEEDYRLFRPLLDSLLEKAGFLNDYTLESAEIEGVNQPVIRKGSRDSLPLYPFMLYTDGEFYYFSDAKLKHKEKLTFLNYCTAQKLVDKASYRFLKKLFPEFDVYEDEVNLRKQRLLDTVIGRYEDARNIEKMVLQAPQSRVFYIFGDPGIGKSAMAAYLNEYYFNHCIKVLHMFVHHEALSLQPEAVFKSIARPLTAEGLIPPVEINTTNPADIKKIIDILLQQASEGARRKNKKIIIIIDGLDEAYNISEHLYNILPSTPPPHVHIIYFSRRKDEIYSRIYRSSAGWIAVDELKPLKREAIRAILWQGISKYTIDETIIDRVTSVSQGNPLYLRFLVNAVLEKRLALSADTLLPRDILEYYDQLILQVVKQNPQLPIIETALAIALCFEPLHQEQIKQILNEASLEDIILSIKALSEIIRPVSLKGYQKKYQLFHKSIAEFLEEQYAETARKIEAAVLFSAIREKRESLEKWFYNFLEGKSLLKLVDEKNISLLLNQTGTFPSAYQVLIKTIASHPNVEEILERCFDLAVNRQNLRIFSLVNDCLLKVVELSADIYIQLVTRLNRQYPEDENLKHHIIDALILLRFSDPHYNKIIDLVIGYLLNYSLIKVKSKRFGYIQTINTISGFARYSDTFTHLRHICSIILNTRRSESIPGEKFEKIEQLLRHAGEFVFNPRFNRLATRLREKDNTRLITRGNESYRRLAFKAVFSILKTPPLWIDFWGVLFRLLGLVIKNGRKTSLELVKRIRTFAEIMQRGFPLIFTSPENPVMNPMGVFMISQIEDMFKTRLKQIKTKNTSLYERVQKESIKGKSEIVANFCYLFSLIVIPSSQVVQFYWQTGRETLQDFSPGEREKVRKVLHLLKAEEGITPLDEEILFDFLSSPDPWENYFALVAVIIHGNTEFNKGKQILKQVLDENPYQAGKRVKETITGRLRIYRHYFSIHTYLLRRAREQELVEDMEKSLAYCLERLYNELTGHPEMIPCFFEESLCSQGGPFNPLLPVGIYQGKTGGTLGTDTGSDKLYLALKKFLQIGIHHPREIKLKIANKLFSELLSLSLFYPGLALRIALRYYKELQQQDNDLQNIVIEKIYLVDLVMPGYLEPSCHDMDIKYEDIKKKLLECKELYSPGVKLVERITYEIRVLAWHECITTLMVSYHKIRDMIIRVIDESFKERLSLPLLIQRIAVEFMKRYFSDEIRGEVKNLFLPGEDI